VPRLWVCPELALSKFVEAAQEPQFKEQEAKPQEKKTANSILSFFSK